MAVPLERRRNNPPSDAPDAPEVVTRESVRDELLRELAGEARTPTQLRPLERIELPPGRLPEPVTPFTQRFSYEELLTETGRSFDAGFMRWGYLADIDPVREWWADAGVDLYMSDIDGVAMDLNNPVESSIARKWRELEPSVWDMTDQQRILFKRSFATRWATEYGLTLRRRERAFKILPRGDMERLFPKLTADVAVTTDVERIGVLQIAATFASRVRKERDTFCLVDIWKHAPEQFGGGKTILMWQILEATAKALGMPFDFRWDIVYSADYGRLLRFLKDRKRFACRGVDELDQHAYKRRSAYGKQKDIIDIWKRIRKWGQLWIGCSPSLWEMDEFLRDIKITHRIRIREWNDETRTGVAELFHKGGDKDEKDDIWGGYNPDMVFEYGTVPTNKYRAYKRLVAYVEDHQTDSEKSALDAYLAAHPDWLLDVINGEKSADADEQVGTSDDEVKSDRDVGEIQ